jgi:hypothetical protein
MKTKSAFVVLGAVALAASGTTAQAKPHNATQLRDLSRQAANAQIRVPSLPTARNVNESYSLGLQFYPNPDRGPYPAPCGTACF